MEKSKIFQALTEKKEEDEILKILEEDENEEDLSVRDESGKSLLHLAVTMVRSINVFKSLLNKVDFTVRDEEGNTAIDLALQDEDYPDEVEDVFRNFVREKIMNTKKEDLVEMELKGYVDAWLEEVEDKDDDDENIKLFKADLPKVKVSS